MEFFDDLETRDPERREREQFAALRLVISAAQQRAPYFTRLLSGVDPGSLVDRTALARLPVTRKSDLIELQQAALPFAGMTSLAPGELARIYASPGPVFDPEGRRGDYWRIARAMHAAGFRRGEIVHNTFAYHFTPAGFMFDLGAQALGCAVIAAGTGQTEMQVRTIAGVRPQCYGGTPSFLRIILEKAEELGADVGSLGKALVSAEALPA